MRSPIAAVHVTFILSVGLACLMALPAPGLDPIFRVICLGGPGFVLNALAEWRRCRAPVVDSASGRATARLVGGAGITAASVQPYVWGAELTGGSAWLPILFGTVGVLVMVTVFVGQERLSRRAEASQGAPAVPAVKGLKTEPSGDVFLVAVPLLGLAGLAFSAVRAITDGASMATWWLLAGWTFALGVGLEICRRR